MNNKRGNNHGKNKDFKSTSECLVTERLLIHVCGASWRKHGAVIGITTLKGNRNGFVSWLENKAKTFEATDYLIIDL